MDVQEILAKENEGKEKFATVVANIGTKLEQIETEYKTDRKDWMKTSEAKSYMDEQKKEIEELDAEHKKMKDEFKIQFTNQAKDIEELKEMFAKQNRPGMYSDKKEDQKTIDYLYTKALHYAGLSHGRRGDDILDKYDFTLDELKQYGDFTGISTKALNTYTMTRAGVLTMPPTIVMQILDVARVLPTTIRPYCRYFRFPTKEMEIALQTAHGVAAFTYETGTMTKDETATFGSKSIKLNTMFHYYDITHQMLDFGYPELLPQLEKDTGIAFAKRAGTAHLLGTNAGEPEGILMNTDITTVNLEETTSITTDDFLKKMYFTLPADFVPNAKWAMLRLTVWELSKMKGGDGHPLLTRLAEKPDFSLLGAQIIQAPDMPAVASAAKSVLFADFEELYAVYDFSGSNLRIQDPYSSKATGVVEFLTTLQTGGAVLNHQAGIIGVNSVTP